MKNPLSNKGGPLVSSRKEKQPNTHDSILYIDGVSVTFDGFKALSELSLVIEKGEMRAFAEFVKKTGIEVRVICTYGLGSIVYVVSHLGTYDPELGIN